MAGHTESGSGFRRLPIPPGHTETIRSVEMEISGSLPEWLNGRLVRLGPALFEIGEHKLNYDSDGMGLLHSYNITEGKIHYQSRYVGTDTFRKNIAEGRFVVNEFGTKASPAPTKGGLLSRIKSKFVPSDQSDNCNHNLVYWKENNALLVVGQSFLLEIDPETLEVLGKCSLPESLGVDIISDHVIFDRDGSCYLLGSHVKGRPMFHILQLPSADTTSKSVEQAKIVASVQGQFKVTSCVSHSFIMTENYFVIVEMPMTINVLKVLTKATILEALEWNPKIKTKFHVIDRRTNQLLSQKYEAEAFYFLHSTNAYELKDHLIIDLIAFKDFTLQDLFNTIKDKNSEGYYQNRPWSKYTQVPVRYVLPVGDGIQSLKGSDRECNLITLDSCKAVASKDLKSIIHLQSQLLTERGEDHIDYPCVNPNVFGKPYKYFYAGGMGLSGFLQYGVGKVSVQSCHVKEWNAQQGHTPTEPVFVKNPENDQEDSGVLLVPIQDFVAEEDRLAILDAESMTEVASAKFIQSSSNAQLLTIPISDHGVFIPA